MAALRNSDKMDARIFPEPNINVVDCYVPIGRFQKYCIQS